MNTLSEAALPASLSPQLAALWYDAKGDWNAAHAMVDNLEGQEAAWIHAYLHRKEGDAGNAGYWYRRAGKKHSHLPLHEEWKELLEAFL